MRRKQLFIFLVIIVLLNFVQYYRFGSVIITFPISSYDPAYNRPSYEKGTGNRNSSINKNSTNSSHITNENRSRPPFTRYDGVVIVTKVLWSKDINVIKTWLCLLSHAYNDKVKYDVVVFTTMPWEENEIAEVQQVALPAKVTVVLEGPSLEERLAALTEDERNFLYERCGKTKEKNLTWFHHCKEPNAKNVANLGYSWQAEFRAYHIWTHPAIREYRYMMWLDSDARLTKEWDVDPMKIMVENNLVLLYSGFPYGHHHSNSDVADILKASYNTSICTIDAKRERLVAQPCAGPATFSVVAGMHHITDMNVYRKDIHQQFLKNYTGPYPFSRERDDQAAVTLVAVMEQYIQNNYSNDIKKELVWNERGHDLTLKIGHHRKFDNLRSERLPGNLLGSLVEEWPGLHDRCGPPSGKNFLKIPKRTNR